MATRFFGERIKRNEDPRLPTGKASVLDDVMLPKNGVSGLRAQLPSLHANQECRHILDDGPTGAIVIHTAAGRSG